MLRTLECKACGETAAAPETFLSGQCARCVRCGSIGVFNLPSVQTLQAFYARFNDDYTAGMGERAQTEMPRRHAAKLRLVRQRVPGGRLLDVGCGEGEFLRQAVAAGFDAEGCDFGLRRDYPPGVRVSEGRLDSPGGLPYPDATFDAVTSWAVIEHVRDPAAAMAELRRVLKPGGFLFCETPLVGDLSERLNAQVPAWLAPPEHLTVFSHAGLAALIKAQGLRPVQHFAFYERNPARWWMRRLRNLLVGVVFGGAQRLATPQRWRTLRRERIRAVGDIQLAVARR